MCYSGRPVRFRQASEVLVLLPVHFLCQGLAFPDSVRDYQAVFDPVGGGVAVGVASLFADLAFGADAAVGAGGVGV